jgi:hypothetical protein
MAFFDRFSRKPNKSDSNRNKEFKTFCIFLSNQNLSQQQMEFLLEGTSASYFNVVEPEISQYSDIQKVMPFLIGLLRQYEGRTGIKYNYQDVTYSRFENGRTNQYGWRLEFPYKGQ